MYLIMRLSSELSFELLKLFFHFSHKMDPLTEIYIDPFFIHIYNGRLEVTLSIVVAFWEEPTAFIFSVEGRFSSL
jgi:hypothetical protein